ncbi:unnamed protein product [Triticum turgidum subsp. durum]|uniref:Uncharacterized protein n=1 Tax=Triticum turgidum subsp. durum TaxID=4567 RepID=A0A9R0XGG6_TRITD|nr:unnamed protein product [Triticum turgidum subsp. durum]
MRKNKRGGDDLTRSSHGGRRAKRATMISEESREGIEETIQIPGDLHGDSNQDVLTELSDEVKSNMSKSVASLAVCSGDTLLFACSGIAIERELYVTKFVTSPKLALVFRSAIFEKKHNNVKIEVRHVGTEVYQGFLDSDDVDEHFSVVKVKTFLDVNVGLIEHAEGILPYGKVVVLGRGTSGELMAKSVILAGDVSWPKYNEYAVLSVAKITKDWEGGPLFSLDGNFIGMNLFLVMERAFFLPWGVMVYLVYNFKTPLENRHGEGPSHEMFNRYQDVYKTGIEHSLFGDVDKMGYPKLPVTMLDDGLVLVNTFEDTFGDVWGEGVWRELGKNASDISRIVVALASLNGEKMFSACTGFFIRWNGSTTILTSASLVRDHCDESKIVENLTIKVLLPNKLVRKGNIEHYSLHYNVALVSVEDCRVIRPAKIQLDCIGISRVAAAGRCFRSGTGTIMATSGRLVSWSGRLDCKFILRSTCKISKAGIGGPIFNMRVEVIGMNFYSEKIGTLSCYGMRLATSWHILRKRVMLVRLPRTVVPLSGKWMGMTEFG